MRVHHSNVRSGVNLIEVLVSIFIMAIGLIALLTLFPVGAISMRQSLQDSRAAQVAANAAAMANAKRLRTDDEVVWEPDVNSPKGKRDVFREPLAYIGPGKPNKKLPAIPDGSPSYPVLVDPLGWLLNSKQVGKSKGKPGFARRCPRFIHGPESAPWSRATQLELSWRWFSNLDDVHFGKDGLPMVDSGALEREGRYSYTCLLQRPDVSRPSVVDLTVVVSCGRPFLVNGSDLAGESTYGPVNWNSNSNVVQVPFTGEQPAFRKGCWVMDCTLPPPGSVVTQENAPHGYFYRVVGVSGPTMISGVQVMTLELQDNPRKDAPNGWLTLFEHVVEAFEKGPGWLMD
jgi:hypothetical protein